MSEYPTDSVDLKQLFARYLRGDYSVADFKALQQHFGVEASQEELSQLVLSALEEHPLSPEQLGARERERIARVIARLDSRVTGDFADGEKVKRIRFRRSWRIVAAAVIILAVLGNWIFFGEYFLSEQVDIPPGGNRATLTLVDGRIVELSSSHEGIIIDGTAIRYLDGRLVHGLDIVGETETSYRDSDEPPGAPFMAITTPRGGTYRLTLPDGSLVWLNAATTLRYPVGFEAGERIVELEGEAYFSVSSQRRGNEGALQPFIVKSRNQTVKVLGTQFNINAYPESEFTKTTLVEGSVLVAAGVGGAPDSKTHTLKPQQQSIVPAVGNEVVVIDIDPEAPIAWKDKFFHFDQERLSDIMVEVARWYDVEVEYTNPELRNKVFSGSVSRFENVSQLLSKLELTGSVQFKIEERRIVVME